jgi:hypothetical protein
MPFDVCWNRRRLEWRRNPEHALWLVEAILLERVLLDGRPQQKIVARLAAIDEDCADKPAARDLFWANADRKLGKLRRLSGTDILGIERELAKRVPIPATAYAATVRPERESDPRAAPAIATSPSHPLLFSHVTRARPRRRGHRTSDEASTFLSR